MTAVAAERTAGRYEAQVAAALRAVEVRPPAAFLWFGRRVAVPPVGPYVDAREGLVDAIAQRLHDDFYGPGAPRPARGGLVTPAEDGGGFVRALSQANCGRGQWQAGWRVAAGDGDGDGDAIAVERPDGLRLLAPAEDCRVAGAVGAGAAADVRVPKELTGFLPGFYVALGDTPGRAGDDAWLFWSIAAAGAVTFVARVTYALNRADVPFRLELLDDPARYGHRPAAAVLLARIDVAAALTLLRPLLRTLGPHLSDGAPAFTKPLARGLALAEEPADGTSFGRHRCLLLATAIVTASEQGLRGTEQLAAVRARFGAAGLRLDAPYLEPGSVDAYELS